MPALENIRVVEWGDLISAAYCTKLLHEFGARIDKIEPPAGDTARAHGPFPADIPDPESSGTFVYLNSGKRSIVADASTAEGLRTLDALLSGADVFVTNQPLALRRRLGLDTRAIRERYPQLVAVSISVFGDTGPNAEAPAQAIDAYAVSGTAWVIGDPARAPLIIPLLQADYQAGAHAGLTPATGRASRGVGAEGDVPPGALQRREEAEADRRHRGGREREQEHRPIEPDLRLPGHALPRHVAGQRDDAAVRQ